MSASEKHFTDGNFFIFLFFYFFFGVTRRGDLKGSRRDEHATYEMPEEKRDV